MGKYDNTDEFATRKFDADEIAKAESEKDFSLNPEAKKYYGESYVKTEEKSVYNNYQSDASEHKKDSAKLRKNKALIAAGVVFVVGIIVFMVILIKMTYRNDVFYVPNPNNEIELERQEPKIVEDEESELLTPAEEVENEPEVTESPYKSSVGNYIFKSVSPEMGECTYNVYVSNVSDDGKILFSVALMNEDSTVMYETGTIAAALNGNRAEFKWGDNHGNSGIGELELNDNSVSIMLIENEISEGNIASLSTDNPITIPRAN